VPRNACKSLLLVVCLYLAGCAVATQITNSPRSGVEQKLVVQALERAFNGLDASLFKTKTVTVEFYGLTPDKDFARELFVAWLQKQGARIAGVSREPELHLKVFAPVIAVDRGQSFFGTPSFTVPVVGFSVPEIAVFKDVRHLGHAEIKISTTNVRTGEFVAESATAIGKAHHDDYTLLIVIHFTHTDLDKPDWDFGTLDSQ
jgi:hypothetical protein